MGIEQIYQCLMRIPCADSPSRSPAHPFTDAEAQRYINNPKKAIRQLGSLESEVRQAQTQGGINDKHGLLGLVCRGGELEVLTSKDMLLYYIPGLSPVYQKEIIDLFLLDIPREIECVESVRDNFSCMITRESYLEAFNYLGRSLRRYIELAGALFASCSQDEKPFHTEQFRNYLSAVLKNKQNSIYGRCSLLNYYAIYKRIKLLNPSFWEKGDNQSESDNLDEEVLKGVESLTRQIVRHDEYFSNVDPNISFALRFLWQNSIMASPNNDQSTKKLLICLRKLREKNYPIAGDTHAFIEVQNWMLDLSRACSKQLGKK